MGPRVALLLIIKSVERGGSGNSASICNLTVLHKKGEGRAHPRGKYPGGVSSWTPHKRETVQEEPSPRDLHFLIPRSLIGSEGAVVEHKDSPHEGYHYTSRGLGAATKGNAV